MNVKERDILIRLQKSEEILYGMVTNRDKRIKELEQQIQDLEGQLRQWGLDAREAENNRIRNGAKKGLFLH